MDRKNIELLAQIIEDSRDIVFFGGAGVSTESGIPDFRSGDGLYSNREKLQISPETILSHSFFMSHPKEFYSYYRKNMVHEEAKPNLAHKALAYLELTGKLSAVVTQNIDGLHQMAGSERVFELHGTVHQNTCLRCGKKKSKLTYNADGLPLCEECSGLMKPDVVLYGETLPTVAWNSAERAIANCDTLIVGGTSLTVYPASMLVSDFVGRKLVIINRDVTNYDNRADLIIRENIGTTLDEAIKLLKNKVV